MFRDKRIAVIVPCFNEEKLIARVLSTIPNMVDEVIVVDDASQDDTVGVVRGFEKNSDFRLTLLQNEKNRGVGNAICRGYKKAVELGGDIAVVMAGDGQMDPKDLEGLVEPVASGKVDYAKGNRLFSGDAWKVIPRMRYLGNAMLSLLTKIASGYWHISDSQTGYTAVSVKTLKQMDLDKVYPRYGMPNDFLVRLNIVNARVRDIPVKPIYDIGENSGLQIPSAVFTISFLLLRLFIWRLKEKYIVRDFHPLVFFYFFGFLFSILGIGLGVVEVVAKFTEGVLPVASVVLVALLVISGFQFLFFAMWFDMQGNHDLR